MSPELMMKRNLMPMQGVNGPVAAAVSAFVATVSVEAVVTGAIIGAVTSAVTGGNILKGALLGGLGGAISSGLSGALGGAAEAGASTVVNGIDDAVNIGAGSVVNEAGTAIGGLDSAVDIAGSSSMSSPSSVGTSMASDGGLINPPSTPANGTGLLNASQNQTLTEAGQQGSNTGVAGSQANAATGVGKTGAGGKTGLLDMWNNMGDRAKSSIIQVGGNAALGMMQGKAQGEIQQAGWDRYDAQRKPGQVSVLNFRSGK